MIVVVNLIFLLAGLLFAFYTIKKYHNPLNHVSIFSSVWVFVILGSQLSNFVVLEYGTLAVLYVSWYCFLIGSYIFNDHQIVPKPINYSYGDDSRLKAICYIIILLAIASNLRILTDVYLNFSSLEDWAQLRKDQEFGIYRDNNIIYTLFGSTSIIYIPLAIYLFLKERIKLSVLILTYVIATLIAFATFNRAPILYLLVVSIVFYSFTANKFSYKIILVAALSLLIIFLVSSYFLSGGNYDSNDLPLYVFGGVGAYQNLLNGGYYKYGDFDSQYYSLDFINYILKTFGFIDSYPDLIREYDPIVITNVYTYLDGFTLDFGILGAFIGSLLIGFFSKIVYLNYLKKESIFNLILYSSFCYYASFIFMNNEYIRFSVILLIIKIIVLSYILKFGLNYKNDK